MTTERLERVARKRAVGADLNDVERAPPEDALHSLDELGRNALFTQGVELRQVAVHGFGRVEIAKNTLVDQDFGDVTEEVHARERHGRRDAARLG